MSSEASNEPRHMNESLSRPINWTEYVRKVIISLVDFGVMLGLDNACYIVEYMVCLAYYRY